MERFKSTLINMLSKCSEKNGKDWDKQLPYVLFANRATVQESTKESPFHLLYGRDPRLPSQCALTVPTTPYMVDLQDYWTEVTTSLMLGLQLNSTSLVHKTSKSSSTTSMLRSHL